MESNDRRNSEIMDLEVPIRLGDGCPFLVKFYGALHAEVIISFYLIFINIEYLDFSNSLLRFIHNFSKFK